MQEIESTENLETHLRREASLARVVVQGLSLIEFGDELRNTPVKGAIFLGCELDAKTSQYILQSGGLIFPRLPNLPYHPYRGSLYNAQSLTEGYRLGHPETLSSSFDQRVYKHYDEARKHSEGATIAEALAQRLHDHAIEDALHDYLNSAPNGVPRRVVAVMGGHGMLRDDPAYRKVARISHALTSRGYVMATGGGPGAMEATNLGAWLAGYPIASIDDALQSMKSAPHYKDPSWWDTSLQVLQRYPDKPGESIAIPTWYYGHEPPNLFATHIAKFFSNSLREDGLLTIAHEGVIYAPGSAGTIQEVFMDACQNHYGTAGNVSAMVFMDRDYWTRTKPVYPLLQSLASSRQYGALLGIEDEEEAIVDFIIQHPPQDYETEK